MKEQFLHLVWNKQLYNCKDLYSEEKEHISIIDKGLFNENDGPDFLEAKIWVEQTMLVGSIELHIYASDWLKHNHHLDDNYNNVILHVVWINDVDISSLKCPTLELQGRVSRFYFDNYKQLLETKEELPCKFALADIKKDWLSTYRNEILISRFREKVKDVELNFSKVKLDRVYMVFLTAIGQPKNKYGFLELACKLPYQILRKYKSDKHKLEALLFGVSGLLMASTSQEQYVLNLKKTFQYLRTLHQLEVLNRKDWVFLRIRPMAFPTVRLALLADLFHKIPSLENFIFEETHVNIKQKLMDLEVSKFWLTHYVFNKKSVKISKRMGESTVLKLWINAIIPLRISYTEHKMQILDSAFNFLQSQPQEINRIVNLMSQNGFDNKNALQSQFNLHKYKYYCIPRKCLNCGIGLKIIRQHD